MTDLTDTNSTNANYSDLAAALLRVSLGLMYVAHGWLKFSVFTIAGTAQFFESVGFPGWTAGPVATAEIIAGIMLIAGVQTRVVAFAFIPVLAGALLVHLPNGWLFSATGGGWEYPAFLIGASAVSGLLGGGKFALSKDISLNAQAQHA